MLFVILRIYKDEVSGVWWFDEMSFGLLNEIIMCEYLWVVIDVVGGGGDVLGFGMGWFWVKRGEGYGWWIMRSGGWG